MVGTSSYTAEQIYFVLQRKREKRQTNQETVEECKVNWPLKHWQPKHIAYIFSKYEHFPEFAPRDPNNVQPIVRPKPQRKPRKPPVNPKSITKSPAVRKPPTKRQKKVAGALQAATRLPVPIMSESEMPITGLGEQNGTVLELEPPVSATPRPPTMEGDGFSYLPNGQLGFEQFERNLDQMTDDELIGYADRINEDNRAGMQSHNQPAESYMDVGGFQGEEHQEVTGYGQPMHPGQQSFNSNTWNQDLNQDQDISNLLNDHPHLFDNLSMPPHIERSQSILDNTGGHFQGNYAQELLAFSSRPNTGNSTTRIQHHNFVGTAQNQHPVATMQGNNHSMSFNNQTVGQHRNNGNNGRSPRDNQNAYASHMRTAAGGPMHATLNTPQPLKLLNAPFVPSMPGILRGSNDEPATGRFLFQNAQKRARDTKSPTPRSTSGNKKQCQGSPRHSQNRVSRTNSPRPVGSVPRTSPNNAARSPSDTMAGSDDSERSYHRVSSANQGQFDGGQNFEPLLTHQPKRIKPDSNGGGSGSQIHNPNKVNMNVRNTMGNGGCSSMNETGSSSVQDNLKRRKNGSAQQENNFSHRPSGFGSSGNGPQPTNQIVHRPRTMNSGMSMHTTLSNLSNRPEPRNVPQIQRPRQNDNMDSRRSMRVASENLGNGQQPRRESQLQQPHQQGTANSNRSMRTASRNGRQAFVRVLPEDMLDPFQTVSDALNNSNGLPLPNSSTGTQHPRNSSSGNPQQNMANGGFGNLRMASQGLGYDNGMTASMQSHQFPMMNQHPHSYHGFPGFGPPAPDTFGHPTAFGNFDPVANMHSNWGPPGIMMMPNYNQYPQQMNYSAIHPSQLPYGLSIPQMQIVDAQYQNNARLASYGGNQTSDPSAYYPVDVARAANQGYVPNALGGGLNNPYLNYIQQAQAGARNTMGGSTTSNVAPALARSQYGMAEASNSRFAHNRSQYDMVDATTRRDAQALVDLQRGMAEETARRYPANPARNTSNGIDSNYSPSEFLHVGTSSNDVMQPVPSRTPAASASLGAILATSSTAQDTPRQDQGQVAQQVAQPSAFATEYSEEDGDFELDDDDGQSYGFQTQPIVNYPQNSDSIEADDHSDLDRILLG